MAQTFPSANLTLQLRDLELALEMRNFRPFAQLQSHLGETTWSLGLSWRISLGFCLFSRLRKPLWGVCWVEPLTRWASKGPYKACGQIPEVPWNWHFVWIGVKSSVCPPSALSTQTKRGTLIASPRHNPCPLERILRITFEWKAPPFDQIRVCQLDFWPFSCPYFCSLIPSQFCPRLFFVPTRPQPCYWSGHLLCKKLFVLFKSHQNLSTPPCFVWSRPFLSDSEIQIIWTLLVNITKAMIYHLCWFRHVTLFNHHLLLEFLDLNVSK